MNTVSLFVYFADILTNLKQLGAGIMIFGGLAGAAYTVHKFLENDRARRYEERLPYSNLSIAWVPLLWVLIALMVCVIPSKETMYLIAGSEIGEVVVTSPEGQEVFKETKDAILRVVKGVGRDKAED